MASSTRAVPFHQSRTQSHHGHTSSKLPAAIPKQPIINPSLQILHQLNLNTKRPQNHHHCPRAPSQFLNPYQINSSINLQSSFLIINAVITEACRRCHSLHAAPPLCPRPKLLLYTTSAIPKVVACRASSPSCFAAKKPRPSFIDAAISARPICHCNLPSTTAKNPVQLTTNPCSIP
ncbi:hypothetical protein M0R45_002297 [Rubus argutus]|uniref:Uncharacterized protein n=1 Tax=Rubus argutus TaxID=59490 RepID=A0AAW1VHD0_RUBAR